MKRRRTCHPYQQSKLLELGRGHHPFHCRRKVSGSLALWLGLAKIAWGKADLQLSVAIPAEDLKTRLKSVTSTLALLRARDDTGEVKDDLRCLQHLCHCECSL